MGLKLHVSTVTVTTAGTRAQATAASTYAVSVYVEALKTNTGTIYVGDSSVSSTLYSTALAAGAGFGISTDAQGKPSSTSGGGEFQLNTLYFDASNSGDKIQVTYLYRIDAY